ncbi:hypothetical protein XENTR_v10010481 [Xenopus tropicalis]|uniref:E3 ubiquitin/ISG15 ligase TRIM25 n=1 Tax=Xenopus tropicalis TaxID=8364 RepID=A0A803JGY1_XENTR|nr:E3 ubiquitin/ISG15 ligase TRIM25 [Xenopus tropicalis]KAE8620803.1 hypothetical protein XENTR_v10010481 [Xenopus tropicalis]
MATADLRDELSCSICLSVYTDPVTLPCGHNFCHGCIGGLLDTQEGSGGYSCPECRAKFQERPALQRNTTLGNLAELFFSTHPEHDGTGIYCTYCINSPVPAAKSCILCEASLCDAHVRVHSKSAEHVLTEPTALENIKCSVHHKFLEYYCCEDGACICVSCCLAGEHRGHRVELLSEASEKKKETLRKVLENLSPEREETERGAQRLLESWREVEEKAAAETERVTALFRGIREELEALEKRLLSDISRQKEELFIQLHDLIQQLEIKRDELSRKIRHIEELCNMAAPLTVLQGQWESLAFCGAEGADTEGREREGIKVLAVGDLDMDLVFGTLTRGLAGIGAGIKGKIYGHEATNLLLDTDTLGKYVSVSGGRKSISHSRTDQHRPPTPGRFQRYPQALTSHRFRSGQHHWEVEGSKLGGWGVGVAYPSIERGGYDSFLGDNDKSWALYRWDNKYSVRYNRGETQLPHIPYCGKIRISLDYEAGRLSFYELSEPIRHLHTFSASFAEPLHAAIGVWNDAWVRIMS